MNIKEELSCKVCAGIYIDPITLVCCGEIICKQHVEELISKNSSNKFTCPLCNEENANQNFKVTKLVQKLINRQLHEFKLNPNHEEIFKDLKLEIGNLEAILKDPENVIYEEIAELKRQVDLKREQLKSQIDSSADELIQQLESYEARFKKEYKTNTDLDSFIDLLESSKKQLAEYEKCLSLFSTKNEERDEKCKESEKMIEKLQTKVNELKNSLFSNVLIKYEPIEKKKIDLFGKLIIRVCFIQYLVLLLAN